jgi:hypothetical protein
MPMPIQTLYSDDGKGLWLRGQGKITGEEVLGHSVIADVRLRALALHPPTGRKVPA